jgi:hypothetical protein
MASRYTPRSSLSGVIVAVTTYSARATLSAVAARTSNCWNLSRVRA